MVEFWKGYRVEAAACILAVIFPQIQDSRCTE